MNLVIDIGNSKTKLAVFQENKPVEYVQSADSPDALIARLLESYPGVDRAILSSVKKKDPALAGFLKDHIPDLLVLDHQSRIPIKNTYQSKSTLGYDRIAAAVAANEKYPGKNILIIDIGTAITIDFVSDNNEFIGGNISPGLQMRLRALHEFTDNLPLLGEIGQETGIFGVDTASAISRGVINGINFELQGYIKRENKRYPDLKVVMTGGDLDIFVKQLKSPIFVDPNLTLKGLNRILNYNA